MDRCEDIRRRCGDAFLLISGDDATAREFILQGGLGVISVTANVAPRLMHEHVQGGAGGRRQAAADTRSPGSRRCTRHLFVESNPIPVKWALREMGRIPAGIRLPLTPLAPGYHDSLRNALRSAGAL